MVAPKITDTHLECDQKNIVNYTAKSINFRHHLDDKDIKNILSEDCIAQQPRSQMTKNYSQKTQTIPTENGSTLPYQNQYADTFEQYPNSSQAHPQMTYAQSQQVLQQFSQARQKDFSKNYAGPEQDNFGSFDPAQ